MGELKLTEGDLQLAIYNYRHRITSFPLVLTNIYLWRWESDALYVSKSGYVHEFEIKISRSDFLRDKNKYLRHKKIPSGQGPTFFYYVCPPDLISPGEIPEYAGLAYPIIERPYYRGDPDKTMTLNIIKHPPRQTSKPLTEKQWREIANKSSNRYWSLKKHHVRREILYDSMQ